MRVAAASSDHHRFAARAAWLSYVGGLRQEDIAERLGVSRVKVNRLIAQAHRDGLIRVFVDGRPDECVLLEDRLRASYGLAFCTVAPTLDDSEVLPLRTLSSAGAHFLMRAFERKQLHVVGVGHGRTLAAVVEHLPRLARSDIRFVSLLGSLTRHAAANPFDVIHQLAQVSGCESYFMPVPFFADSVADKQVLMAQKTVRDVFALACEAQLHVVGIGQIGAQAHMYETGMVTPEEFAEAERAGAVGEVLGHFVDAAGRPVDAPVNQRSIALRIDDLRGKEVVVIAGGRGKVQAIEAVLATGVVTGLITDEATALQLAFGARRERARASCNPLAAS